MRKNRFGGKIINNVYCKYSVAGVNQLRLLNLLQKNGVSLFKIKIKSKNRMSFFINQKHEQKFFAILKKLCYNENIKAESAFSNSEKNFFKRLKSRFFSNRTESPIFSGGGYTVYKAGRTGKGLCLQLLLENTGILLGAISFALIVFFCGDICFSVEFSGSGSVYRREVEKLLSDTGIKKYCRFSSLNLEDLSNEIVAKMPALSFAECKKSGNVLKVELELKQEDKSVLDTSVENLYSDSEGVVESIKVYSGTARVKTGDCVKTGDLLVAGFVTVKENTVKTCVICKVVLRCESVFTYVFSGSDKKNQAISLALEQMGDRQVLNPSVDIEKQGREYVYKVCVPYTKVLTAG